MTLSAQLHPYRRTARRWSRPLPGEAPGRDGAHRLRAGPPSRHSPTSSQDGCPRLQTWERRTPSWCWAVVRNGPAASSTRRCSTGRSTGSGFTGKGWRRFWCSRVASGERPPRKGPGELARTTREEAERVARLLAPRGVRSILLVTDVYQIGEVIGRCGTANPSREEPLGPPRPRLPNVARRLLRRRSVARPLTGRAPRRPGTHAGASGRDRGVCRAESPAGRGADPRNSHAHGYFLSRYFLDERIVDINALRRRRIVDINALRRRSPTACPPAPPAVSLQPGTPEPRWSRRHSRLH
jgi:hypothetical protein